MTHLPGGRQTSPHLRLCPAEVKALWERGHYSPKGYLYQLVLAHRRAEWSWKVENVTAFCKEWGFVRRTFYKAKAALIDEGLLSEEIEGAIQLTAHRCAPAGTGEPHGSQPVPHGSQPVPHGSQPVPHGSHSGSETLDSQSICDPTDLYKFKTTTTQESGGVSVDDLEEGTTLHGENADYSNEAKNPEKDTYAPPILLQAKNKFGINLDDRQLQKAIEQWPERVEVAIACLEEKQLTVKHPTRYLTRAIEDDWRPEKQTVRSDWREWYDEAYKRGLVRASQSQGDTIMVLTIDEHWVSFEHLRRQSWEELEAQLKPITVDSQAVPENLSEAQVRTLEAMAVLVEE